MAVCLWDGLHIFMYVMVFVAADEMEKQYPYSDQEKLGGEAEIGTETSQAQIFYRVRGSRVLDQAGAFNIFSQR